MGRFLSLTWFFLLVVLLPLTSAQPGHVGSPPRTPRLVPAQVFRLILAAPPDVLIQDKGAKAVLTFRTRRPTPGATCYYGTYMPDQVLPTPRYRWMSVEALEKNSTSHAISLDFARMNHARYDLAGFKKNRGGVVCYRLEIQDPGNQVTRFLEGRFAVSAGERIPCVVEGPFVDLVTETTAVISWRTDLPSGGAVVADGRGFPSSKKAGLRHEVGLDGLEAGKRCRYRVEVRMGKKAFPGRPFWFETPAPDSKTLTFAFMSDSRAGYGSGERAMDGVNVRMLRTLSRHAYHQGAELMLFGGDLINGGVTSEEEFRRQLRTWKSAVECVGHYIPIYEGMGNHESLVDLGKLVTRTRGADGKETENVSLLAFDKPGASSAEAVFADEFVNPPGAPTPEHEKAPPYEESVYAFDRSGIRFISFNTNYWYCNRPEEFGGNLEGYVLDNQLCWIQERLEEAARGESVRHVFLFAHDPAFPCGGHVHDGQWYHGGAPLKNGGIDRTYVVKRRDALWKAVARCPKVAAVLFGHEHNYSRTRIDKTLNPEFKHPVWQIVSGGCGAPYYARDRATPWDKNVAAFSAQQHYCLFRVDGDRVLLEVYGETGERIDRAALR